MANTVCVACGIYVAAIRQRRHILDALPKSFRIGYFFGCPAGPVVQVGVIDTCAIYGHWLQQTFSGFLYNSSRQMLRQTILGNPLLDYDVSALPWWPMDGFSFLELPHGQAAVVIDNEYSPWSFCRFTHRCVTLLFFSQESTPFSPQAVRRNVTGCQEYLTLWMGRTIRLLDKLIAMTLRKWWYYDGNHLDKVLTPLPHTPHRNWFNH